MCYNKEKVYLEMHSYTQKTSWSSKEIIAFIKIC